MRELILQIIITALSISFHRQHQVGLNVDFFSLMPWRLCEDYLLRQLAGAIIYPHSTIEGNYKNIYRICLQCLILGGNILVIICAIKKLVISCWHVHVFISYWKEYFRLLWVLISFYILAEMISLMKFQIVIFQFFKLLFFAPETANGWNCRYWMDTKGRLYISR